MPVSDDYKEGYRAGIHAFGSGLAAYIQGGSLEGADKAQILQTIYNFVEPGNLASTAEKALAQHIDFLENGPPAETVPE